jgi:tetratricopeptide (TPR) repeat protein
MMRRSAGTRMHNSPHSQYSKCYMTRRVTGDFTVICYAATSCLGPCRPSTASCSSLLFKYWKLFVSIVVIALLIGPSSIAQSPSPTSAEIEQHVRKAQDFLKTNRPDLAIPELREVLVLDPDNAAAMGDLGTLLYFGGNYEEAVVLLRNAVKEQPDLWKTLTLLGMCEKRLGNVEPARSDLEKAFFNVTDMKLRVEAGLELIEIYYASRDLDKAAGIVGVLQKIKPNDPGILSTAHRIYIDQADEAELDIALSAPNSAWMQQLIAEEMWRQGNREAAATHYREALKINDRVPGLHFELAEVLSQSSSPADRDAAEQEYRAALVQDPFDEKSECRLGKIAQDRSDLEGAFAHYSRALKLQPNDPEANFGLGTTLYRMGQKKKALELLERSAQLDPSDPSTHYRLFSLYKQVGRADDAKRELAEFMQLKKAKESLDSLYQEMRRPVKPEETESDLPQ